MPRGYKEDGMQHVPIEFQGRQGFTELQTKEASKSSLNSPIFCQIPWLHSPEMKRPKNIINESKNTPYNLFCKRKTSLL